MVLRANLSEYGFFGGVGWGLWSKLRVTDTRNLASMTTFGTEVEHILALCHLCCVLCNYELQSLKGKRLYVSTKCYWKNVMVQNVQQETM